MFVRLVVLGCLALVACRSGAGASQLPDVRAARAGPKASGPEPASEDHDLAEAVRERLANHPGITPDGIQVSAAAGVVTLSGRADSDFERQQAELSARWVHDVKQVKNELRVMALPMSGRSDARLAAELEAAFADDPRIDAALV